MRAVVCLAALVAPVALAAQDAQGEDAPVYDLAWHNAQQLAVAKLRQEDGWRVLEGGLRYRFIEGDGGGEGFNGGS